MQKSVVEMLSAQIAAENFITHFPNVNIVFRISILPFFGRTCEEKL
jgi:hypothetical protein